jgi:hypothetical protein
VGGDFPPPTANCADRSEPPLHLSSVCVPYHVHSCPNFPPPSPPPPNFVRITVSQLRIFLLREILLSLTQKSYQRINCFPVPYQTSPSHPFFCFNPPPRWGEGEVSQKVGSRVLFWFSSFLSSPKKFCLSVWEVYIFYFISFLTSDSILFGRVQSKNGCRNQAIRLPCGWCS